jgi:hypothetical protein
MGIQILNKDVSVISSVMGKPKASIGSIFGTTGWAGGVPFVPGDFAFTDGNTDYTTNTVTFTKSGRLYIQSTGQSGEMDLKGYLNGQLMYFWSSDTNAIAYPNTSNDSGGALANLAIELWGVFDVSIGNTMYFTAIGSGSPVGDLCQVNFRITSFAGTLIDSFQASKSGCYLTTATVQFKGLLDDGPELTAMRTLREHYRGDTYYDNLIAEYYQSSVAIIQGIDNSVDPSVDYEFIYQSVLKVKDFVDQSMWVEGWNEYYNAYLTLKNKYITNV